MSADTPTVVVVGGPNGAGKSTIAPRLLGDLGIDTFVNADVIARGLSAFDPGARAFKAGRIMLRELRRLAEARETFAFETTLASRTFAPWTRELVDSGYVFVLCYVWVQHADIAVQRVQARVRSGGHDMPEEDVRRRWSRSASNFWSMYQPLAHHWYVYDNSMAGEATRVAFGGRKRPTHVLDAPRWEALTKANQ